jgi:endoglucanase
MRRSLFGIIGTIAILTLGGCQRATAEPASDVPASRLQTLSRGINLDNVVNNVRMANYGGDEIRKLKAMGFTYVRIPIDPSFIVEGMPVEQPRPQWQQPVAPENQFAGTADPERVNFGWKRLDEHVDKFIRGGLGVTLVVQPMKAFSRLPAEQTEPVILKADQLLAQHYANRYSPEQLFFEVLNEPHYDNATWDEFAPRLVAAIRQYAPRHTIIVPPAWWDLPENFKDLTPINDPDIVYTMHVYKPNALTQQGAGGGHHPEFRFPKPPGSTDKNEWSEEQLDAYLRQGVDWAAEHHVPLIMNEFGTTNVADRDSRRAWVKFMIDEADKYHYGWAWWAFDGRLFGLNPHGKGYDPDLVELLSRRA